jgi:TonB family protein
MDRNWVVPMAVFLARHAETIVDFTVQRDGKVTEIGLVKSCGIVALDRAVRNAILSSRLHPLPADYGPPTLTFRLVVTFDASPQGS